MQLRCNSKFPSLIVRNSNLTVEVKTMTMLHEIQIANTAGILNHVYTNTESNVIL